MKTIRKGSLAELKRRIKIGTRLLCVRNTLRPKLDGTTREVVRTLGVAFVWKEDGSTGESWTRYPKAFGLTWVDDDTFRLILFDSHYVEMKFLPESPAVAAIGATEDDAREWLAEADASYKADNYDRVMELCDRYCRWRSAGNEPFDVTAAGATFSSDHVSRTLNNFSSTMKRGPVD